MRDDIPAAAFRLLSVLPVRTHERLTTDQMRARQTERLGKGGRKGRPLRIAGKQYRNIGAARIAHRVSYRTIYRWLEIGRAAYV